MKTYYEEQTDEEKPFDWFEALTEVDMLSDPNIKGYDYEKFSTYHDRLLELSNSWVTCACGNQCALIPRRLEGDPVDEELNVLGRQFAIQIAGFRYHHAIEILHKIEERSSQILEEL